jgi:hypothetical protein
VRDRVELLLGVGLVAGAQLGSHPTRKEVYRKRALDVCADETKIK